MSDMKKIKTKLVTFVTDKVLLVTYFGNKDFLRVESTIAAMGHDAAQAATQLRVLRGWPRAAVQRAAAHE
jgi:hypothetical protein